MHRVLRPARRTPCDELMNVFFVCYLIATVALVGWFLVYARTSGWRRWVLLLAGLLSVEAIAVALPCYIVLGLGSSGMVSF